MPAVASHYRVIFADTDAGAIVYHARYLEMAERSRTEAMRAVGIEIGPLFAARSVAFVLRSARLSFRAPARLDDWLRLEESIITLTPARSIWRTMILRDRVRICDVEAELVCIDLATHHPILLPPELGKRLSDLVTVAGRRPSRIVQTEPSS